MKAVFKNLTGDKTNSVLTSNLITSLALQPAEVIKNIDKSVRDASNPKDVRKDGTIKNPWQGVIVRFSDDKLDVVLDAEQILSDARKAGLEDKVFKVKHVGKDTFYELVADEMGLTLDGSPAGLVVFEKE